MSKSSKGASYTTAALEAMAPPRICMHATEFYLASFCVKQLNWGAEDDTAENLQSYP